MLDYQKGEIDQAFNWLNRAAAVNPFSEAATFMLGELLRQQGRLDEAIPNLLQSIELDPTMAAAHNSLGAVAAGARQGR